MAGMLASTGSKTTYCFLDLDVDGHRKRYSTAAAFVFYTDTRYGWSSKDIRELGGSELQRVADFYATDHEWSNKGTIATSPPACGVRVIVELFEDVAPLACQNFARLCRGAEPALGECGKPLAYVGSKVHRVQPGFVIQVEWQRNKR